jgi:hypothetical protein
MVVLEVVEEIFLMAYQLQFTVRASAYAVLTK